jgi:hypothetical protein
MPRTRGQWRPRKRPAEAKALSLAIMSQDFAGQIECPQF